MSSADAVKTLRDRFADAILDETEFRGEISLSVAMESLREICRVCREELGFDYLLDISSVDHFGEEPRYEMVYELCVLETATHLRLKAKLSEENPVVPTVSDLWEGANWHEREVFDMMGLRFENHPDLRRILMWEGYPYHPLKKDFPLEGKPADTPEVAFSNSAPLAGGPFVTSPTDGTTQVREPRARRAGDLPPEAHFIAEP